MIPPTYCDRMPASRSNVSSGSDFESAVGYSRAVRVGPQVAVAGTTGAGDNLVAQTRDALSRIETALGQAGATLADVVRTRIYVTDISRCARSATCTRRSSAKSVRRPPWSRFRR
jgi:enamine deaminase RidA (YjgF/YER057c/UK114 family)